MPLYNYAVDADNKQRLNTLAFGLEFYKVLMGVLNGICAKVCDDSVCTVSQNIYDDELFHRIAISFNAFSFLTFWHFITLKLERRMVHSISRH